MQEAIVWKIHCYCKIVLVFLFSDVWWEVNHNELRDFPATRLCLLFRLSCWKYVTISQKTFSLLLFLLKRWPNASKGYTFTYIHHLWIFCYFEKGFTLMTSVFFCWSFTGSFWLIPSWFSVMESLQQHPAGITLS